MTISSISEIKIDKNDIPDDVLLVLKKIEEAGFLSFLVGGCVRDLLYKKIGKDWDIATEAKPEQIKEIFCDCKTLLIGKNFQTITLIMDSKIYHISTFRYCNNKNLLANKVNKKGENYALITDLLCRDFTINAIAWNHNRGLVDPAGGLRDLQKKVVRSLKPDFRFKEDPLRMLRAIRIACELSFTIENQTKRSIIKHAFLIRHVSPERIREEISLILKSPEAKRGVLLLRQYGLERHIFIIDGVKKELLAKKRKGQELLSGLDEFRGDLSVQLALWGRLFFGSSKVARIFYLPMIKKLRFKKKIADKVQILLRREWQDIDFSSRENIRFLMAELGKENINQIFFLKKIILLGEHNTSKLNQLKKEERLLKEELEKNPPVKLADLAIKGDDLIKIGIPEGKDIGEILRLLTQKVLISPESNQKDYLIGVAKEIWEDLRKLNK